MCDANDVRLPSARLRERGRRESGSSRVVERRPEGSVGRNSRRGGCGQKAGKGRSWEVFGRSLGGLWERGRGPACVEEKREENQTVDMNRRGKV